jgi:hypothetical protein
MNLGKTDSFHTLKMDFFIFEVLLNNGKDEKINSFGNSGIEKRFGRRNG